MDKVKRCLKIHGLMTLDEMNLLYAVARKAPKKGEIIELGTFNGRATAVLCSAVRHDRVVSIDSYIMQHNGESNIYIAVDNLNELRYNPVLIESRSTEIPEYVNEVALLLIDTDHRDVALKEELKAWIPLTFKGSLLVLHDYNDKRYPTMRPYIDRYFGDDTKWEFIDLVGSLIVFRRIYD